MPNRFHGNISLEYELLVKTIPYYYELQDALGKEIYRHYKDMNIDQIKVLEVGTGTGITTRSILENNPKAIVTSVEKEADMLKQAKKNLEEYIKHGKIGLIESDALEYLKCTGQNKFDVFASGIILHNFRKEERNEILQLAYGIIKKDGIFVNADKYALDDEQEFNKTLEWQIEQYKKVFLEENRNDILKEWLDHEKYDKKPGIIMRQNETIQDMKNLGFRNIKITYRNQMHAVLVAKK